VDSVYWLCRKLSLATLIALFLALRADERVDEESLRDVLIAQAF